MSISEHPVGFAVLFPFIPELQGYKMLGDIIDEALGNEPSDNIKNQSTSQKVALATAVIFKTILFAALAATLASAVIHFAVTPCMGYLIDAAIVSASAYVITATALCAFGYLHESSKSASSSSNQYQQERY